MAKGLIQSKVGIRGLGGHIRSRIEERNSAALLLRTAFRETKEKRQHKRAGRVKLDRNTGASSMHVRFSQLTLIEAQKRQGEDQ